MRVDYMKRILFFFLQCTWGSFQSFIGFVVFLFNLKRKHYFYHGAIIIEWKKCFSASLGLFIFMSVYYPKEKKNPQENTYLKILVHEYGHTIQSLLLGPLYMMLIWVPSFIWFINPALRNMRQEKNISYFSFYTEKWADFIGEKVTGEKTL